MTTTEYLEPIYSYYVTCTNIKCFRHLHSSSRTNSHYVFHPQRVSYALCNPKFECSTRDYNTYMIDSAGLLRRQYSVSENDDIHFSSYLLLDLLLDEDIHTVTYYITIRGDKTCVQKHTLSSSYIQCT